MPTSKQDLFFSTHSAIAIAPPPNKELLIFAEWAIDNPLAKSAWSAKEIVQMCQGFEMDTLFKEIGSGFMLGNEGIYLNKAALYPKRFFSFLMRAIVKSSNPEDKEILSKLLLDMANKYAGHGHSCVGDIYLNFSLTGYAMSMGYLEASHPDFNLIKKACQAEWCNNLAIEKILTMPLDLICAYATDNQYAKKKGLLLDLFLTASLNQDDYIYFTDRAQFHRSKNGANIKLFAAAKFNSILIGLFTHPTLGPELVDFSAANKGLDYLSSSYAQLNTLTLEPQSVLDPVRPIIERHLLGHKLPISITTPSSFKV